MEKPVWLFFDLGSMLIDETEAYAARVRETVSGTDVSAAQFAAAMQHFFSQGSDGYKEAVCLLHLQKAPWRSELEHLYADCHAVLDRLKCRGYRLGVIANQQPGTVQRLAHWELLPFFDVIAASAELGMAKPDPAIFRWALRQADCEPYRAVMIGDRIDNDVLPAKTFGMRTVRLLSGPFAAFCPHPDPSDHTVRNLSALTDHF